MAGETLPGVAREDRTDARVVLHVDMDCFYASCERLREPSLRGEPLVVGMGYEDGESFGAVATASYEAREFGVESAQPISQALERLPPIEASGDEPGGRYRPVDIEYYQSVAEEVREILHDCADVVREVSIDEAYLDVTDSTAWRTVDDGSDRERTLAEGVGRHLKQRIAREVGVPASVGVAPNMSAAKVASDHDKPDGLVVVPPGSVRDFLAPLSVTEVHGVGPVTAREMGEMGIETAGDLAAADPDRLEARFGSRGRELHDRARGVDDREVTPTGRPKSLSRESAFAEATDDADEKADVVTGLAADVADRARRRGAMYRTIGIKVVVPPYDVNTRARSLSGPVDDPDLVREVALDLLAEFDGDAARKVGVRVSNLSFADADQSRLDGWEGSDATVSTDEADEAPAGAESAESDGERGDATDGQVSLGDFD
ncbi:DNA polymerase IV [Halogeometricum sp. S1BR25-6]|uniref:DNA polymerase IV n=1 Tax=Halogeometricum salsisoli TaxID=2950536 RepID=A0ABU2GEN2_9EURY|nr:DNA polymerase IV [Halogeometricum sp. S1BR25-6]MDS0298629.1 DNA polymerase IV [Halogeometricum sp. S1BR25-6]